MRITDDETERQYNGPKDPFEVCQPTHCMLPMQGLHDQCYNNHRVLAHMYAYLHAYCLEIWNLCRWA